MGKLIGFLFPWRNTFRRLELEKRWWHRLATVLFFVALTPTLLYSWVIVDDANSPLNSFEHINYWETLPPHPATGTSTSEQMETTPPGNGGLRPGDTVDTTPYAPLNSPDPNYIPPAPDGSQGVPNPNYVAPDSKDLRKTIEMPDGKTATYPGTTSDVAIEAEWKHKLSIATAKAALFGFGIAVLVTLLFGYLLQAAYRALVYVIYGAKARAAPGSPAAG